MLDIVNFSLLCCVLLCSLHRVGIHPEMQSNHSKSVCLFQTHLWCLSGCVPDLGSGAGSASPGRQCTGPSTVSPFGPRRWERTPCPASGSPRSACHSLQVLLSHCVQVTVRRQGTPLQTSQILYFCKYLFSGFCLFSLFPLPSPHATFCLLGSGRWSVSAWKFSPGSNVGQSGAHPAFMSYFSLRDCHLL